MRRENFPGLDSTPAISARIQAKMANRFQRPPEPEDNVRYELEHDGKFIKSAGDEGSAMLWQRSHPSRAFRVVQHDSEQ